MACLLQRFGHCSRTWGGRERILEMTRTEREELILVSVRICRQRHHHDRYPKSFDPVIFVLGVRNAVSHAHSSHPCWQIELKIPLLATRTIPPSFSSFCISDWSYPVSSFSIFVIVFAGIFIITYPQKPFLLPVHALRGVS